MSAEPARPSETHGSEMANRLLTRAIHEDADLKQVGSFFLVAESMLVVAYSGLLGGDAIVQALKGLVASEIIAVFGLLLALVWLYVAYLVPAMTASMWAVLIIFV